MKHYPKNRLLEAWDCHFNWHDGDAEKMRFIRDIEPSEVAGNLMHEVNDFPDAMYDTEPCTYRHEAVVVLASHHDAESDRLIAEALAYLDVETRLTDKRWMPASVMRDWMRRAADNIVMHLNGMKEGK